MESKDIVKHCGHCGIFYVSIMFIQCNTHSCCEHIAGVVNIYLCCCVSLLAPMHAVCLCVWYQVRILVKNHMCQTSVNLMHCCIKHTTRSFWYYGTKAWHVLKYWVGAQLSQPYLIGRRCHFSLVWPPF